MIADLRAFLGRADVLRRIHGILTLFWIGLWIVGWACGWLSSVTFVSHLSAVALVLGSWSSWQAARAEVAQRDTAQS